VRTAAIFIDAGYLYSGGTALLYGAVQRRRDVRLADTEQFIALLARRAAECCDGDELRILRTYWYDGAREGVPSPEQIAIGELPRVKLRLGRVSGGGQKGVDGLVILDLINLARNRAIDVAVVLSGDEDIREAALYAQGFGVSLIVAGFEASAGQDQSALLLREADHVVRLDTSEIERHIRLVDDAANAPTTHDPDTAPESAPDAAQAEESVRAVCASVMGDERFATVPAVREDGDRLTYRADRILVAKLAELTGTFPVDSELLARARAICLDLWSQRRPT
jgi:uncharacterized LabA/DUF88 family protein